MIKLLKLSSGCFSPRSYEEIVHVAHHIFNMVKRKKNPEIGIICGSGLGDIPSVFEDTETVPYSKIPGFPNTTGEFKSSSWF